MAVVVISCAAYRDAWGPFSGLFAKFWGDCPYPRYLISAKPPDDSQIHGFLPLWAERDVWIEKLAAGLAKIDDAAVLLFQEDFFLCDPVLAEKVESGRRLVTECYYDCARVYPGPGGDGEPIGKLGYADVTAEAEYRISCQAAWWNRERLIHLCQRLLSRGRQMCPDFEHYGQALSEDFKIASWIRDGHSSTWPVSYHCSAIGRGKWARAAIDLCKRNGIAVSGNREVEDGLPI